MNSENPHTHLFWLTVALVGLLILGLLEMPYGYYQFLRLAICGVTLYSLYASKPLQENGLLKWLIIAVAVIYNPILPLHLPKETWMLINVGTTAFLGYVAHVLHGLKSEK